MTTEAQLLAQLNETSVRFAQQVAAGEWSGPAARDWLSCRYPCGRHTCRMCNSDKGGYGYRGLPPWSQVIASWGPGFRPRRPLQ